MCIKLMEIKKINRCFLYFSYALSFIIACIVFYTGGTYKVYSNLMYIPIALVSSSNGKARGIIHAFISGLLIGPFMPLNESLNQIQEPINWILRTIIYICISFIIGYFSDYNKKHKEQIINLLTHDNLTDLKNIESLKREDDRINNCRTVIALSVKSYQEGFGIFGYDFTNQAILNFCHILKEELSSYNNIEVYKYNGMEFILIVNHCKKKFDIYKIMDSLETLNKRIVKVEDIPIYIETVMGKTMVGGDVPILEGVRQSMIALRYATQNNIKMKEFDSNLDTQYKNVVDIAGSFKSSLDNNNIKVAFQNLYHSNDESIYGVELLARWVYDDGIQIFPGEFIPVIENTELINELTRYMIDTAIILLSSGYYTDQIISINFSSKDFNDENVFYLIHKIQEYGLNPRQFEVEITEEILLIREESFKYLNILREQGIIIAMDDFGTGYSSYQQLSEIPIDVVKIDRSIIRNIGDSIFSKSLAESIDFFCKYNNIITIAEGVETKEIADVCKEIGIDVLQGYYFHKPTLIESEVKAMI